MEPKRKVLNTLILLFALSPLAYLLFVWHALPETVVLRFTLNEPVAKEQNKQTLLYATIVVSIIAIGIYFLMQNLKKIDPKVSNDIPTSGFNRMGLSVTVFLVLLNYVFILSALHAWEISKNIGFIFFGLFIAVLGNYMYNIRPNFFAGIRLPWTLNDENNWRQTHRLAGKIWFLGGILVAFISGFLPEVTLKPFMISVLVLIALIPCVYSYRLFKRKK